MDKVQQDKIWSELSEGERTHLKSMFVDIQNDDDKYANGYLGALIDIFGEHNLKIKTWGDIQKVYKDWPKTDSGRKVDKMCSAAAQIAVLIELGYGGMMSEEEWCNNNIEKWCVVWQPRNNTFSIISYENNFHFITFHTQQQAKEFMSHESNRKLVEEYYMT